MARPLERLLQVSRAFKSTLHPRRLWKGAVAVFVVVVVFLYWFRSWGLRRIPDVGEPFDIVAAAHVDVPVDQNAFGLYRRASAALRPLGSELREQFSEEIRNGWEHIPVPYRQWLEENRHALELYRQGTVRLQALYIQPGEQSQDAQLTVTQSLRDLSRLAQLEALRLEASGDFRGAWESYRSILQSSRHSGCNGCLIERLVGCAIHSRVTKQIARWSSLRGVDATLLRTAFAEVREIYSHTSPASGTIQVEYLLLRQLFVDQSLLDKCLENRGGIPPHLVWRAMWLAGEPETSRRAASIVFANWLSQCDRPREQRAPIRTKYGTVFLPDPTAGPLMSPAMPQLLEDWLEAALIHDLIMSYVPQLIVAIDREDARQRLIETTLALQVYRSERGFFPESLEHLVGDLMAVLPTDPFDAGGALRYRRDAEGATVWSIGDDEIDDGAEVDLVDDGVHGDIIIQVKAP